MNIAVFADIHGRVLLAFTLCARWERETGERLDLILQAGDLGAYPNADTLDRATRLHAKNDATELGFMQDFTSHDTQVAATLAKTNCPMICVRGNHEDHEWLDTLEAQASSPIYSIDAYQRVWMLKTGVPYMFHVKHWRQPAPAPDAPTASLTLRDGQTDVGPGLTIIGVGRIGAPAGYFGDDAERRRGSHAHDQRQRLRNADPRGRRNRYIQPEESARIRALRTRACDVLLTHDCAVDAMMPGSGSDEIGWLLAEARPAYHFFGHYGGPCVTRTDANGVTSVCKLADLHWNPTDYSQRLEAGSMGLLRWQSAEDHQFEVVSAPWLREYTAHSWRHL